MSTLTIEYDSLAVHVDVMDEMLKVILSDGREVAVPLAWFPRLMNATDEQRKNWRFIGGGVGIHWESVDEDIAIETLLRQKNHTQAAASTKNHWQNSNRIDTLSAQASSRVIPNPLTGGEGG
ncbi:MAG: DUF2442 domain-containing protein [Magnetococcus sp. YQC-5]